MKKITLFLSMLFILNLCYSQHKIEINNWLRSGSVKIFKPVFADTKDINGTIFKNENLLSKFKIDLTYITPKIGESIKLGSSLSVWEKISIGHDSVVSKNLQKESITLLAGYINAERWTDIKFKLSCNALYELYIDNVLKKTKKNAKTDVNSVKLKLTTGKHLIVLKILNTETNLKVKAFVEFNNKLPKTSIKSDTNARRILEIDDIVNGERISSAQISPSGKYLLISYRNTIQGSGKSKSYMVLKNLYTKENIHLIRNQNIKQIKWLPKTDKLSYTCTFNNKTDIYLYNVEQGTEKLISVGFKNFSSYKWSPTEGFLIWTEYVKSAKKEDLKRIHDNDDRLPSYRNRSFLHMINISSGTSVQLTSGSLSTRLYDIHPSGFKILFSTTKRDYTEIPFTKQNLYELNIYNFRVNSIWKNKRFSGRATYSPDGRKLLVRGGPECFEELGKNVSVGKIANNYDKQLYIYDLVSKQADPITYNFNPSVSSSFWSKDNNIYIKVNERDYVCLYKYSPRIKKFEKINLNPEVLGNINYSKIGNTAVYTGTSISTPNKLYLLNLETNVSSEIVFPEEKRFSEINFGKHEEWNFKNKKETTIYGRVYYPPNYDQTKKYPVIVNYYGGTSPVPRSFGGRYPANVWTANGYIVYLLQPSGATGFGQEFSALHVNGWGLDAIDDIIDGTRQFLVSHPSADANNVGCIGASYGGFTTMLLQTRTDIFKTAISHAGISSITSYWGEGYWGYSYSVGAATNSYPWNRKDIYVNNSPLYNADKFKNSILLLHGTADTNVPVGESLQFYAALKILGKDVEMVLIDGQNHWIVDYKKRIKWHYTIMSWFDKKLKNQAQHWNNLYPKKNY